MNEENVDEIPLGIVLSMILYAIYIHILHKLAQVYNVDKLTHAYNIDKLIQVYNIDKLIQVYNIDKLIHVYNIDNWVIYVIYLIPLIILYIETPILLAKYKDRWQSD